MLLADIVLITGDVNAIDTIGGIDKALTLVLVVFPFTDKHFSECIHGKSETIALVILPHSVVVGAVGCQQDTMSGAFSFGRFSSVYKSGKRILLVHNGLSNETGSRGVVVD